MTHAGGSSDYSCFRGRRAVRVGAGFLVGVLALPCLVLGGEGTAEAGGAGDKALRMTVTVNTRGHSGQRPPAVRAGDRVVKRYRLENRGEADLYGVRVRDPGVPAGAVRCPGRPLHALGVMECVARFRALPGDHRADARAEGAIPSLGRTLTATAASGYTGVAGALALAERVAPAARAGTAVVTYTVANRGNRPLHDVRVTDPALGLSGRGVDCGAVPLRLAPGASARCVATVRRPPGTHRSTGLATGTDRVATYAPGGRRLPAPLLTARSTGSFTVPEERRKPSAAPDPAPAAEPGGGSGSGRGGGGAGGGGSRGGIVGAPGAAGAVAPGPAPAPAVGVLPVGPPGPDPAPPGAAAGGAAEVGAGVAAEVAAGVGAAEGAVEAGPGAVPPGALPPGAVPPGALPPGALPPGALPPGAVVGEARVPGVVVPPRTDTSPEASRRAATLAGEGFLGRVRRRGREAGEMGTVVMLLLILLPAALAAALLGNRRT
ncbi:hypothetical protein ACFRFJ_03385 [Streptomyces hydrogenans]|uniref:DUF7507 domain-containing protein n=1 Tax=Streptomyces hydrogenans TaxID=1873719 RepID=UPI0036CD784B